MGDVCPQCGNEYQIVASHWSRSSCEWLSFTDHQREVITGLLMGDGSINRGRKNPQIKVEMISPNYLKYIDSKFEMFGKGVSLKQTAEESAKRCCDSGFSPNAKVDDYSDLHLWYSMAHPELQEFAEWYSTGKKVWPSNIKLTPTVLKHWYCGDGTWYNSGSHNHIRIGMSNEVENTEKVDQMFENVGLPSPINYDIWGGEDGSEMCNALFTVEQSKELWEYMGEPLPDFEYKWPEQYRKS